MNINHTLEFDKVLDQLAEYAHSIKTKEKLLLLQPFLNERDCKIKINETTEGVKIIDALGEPPLDSMTEMELILALAEKGSMLTPEQLVSVSFFITACRRMKSYLKRAEYLDVNLSSYGEGFDLLETLVEEIHRSIRNGIVDNDASPELHDIRRKIENAQVSVKTKLESMLRSKKEWFADGYLATRNGRFVLPVKKEYKNQVPGSVIDTSSSGNTYFIEPSAIRKIQEEVSVLQIEEDIEVRKILYSLTALVDAHTTELTNNMACMNSLDFIFAKAKLSLAMMAIPPTITTERKIIIKQGRHPLLNPELCVPLDFEIGEKVNGEAICGVIITGPNTGGKTVALKTVGLLSLMAQCGLHVPVKEGSIFSMHYNVLADIGDGQSISENLSTFSSHIKNIIGILKAVSNESLVLLDELGSGTDPAEGRGIAIAILAELKRRNCLFVATTHYPEIKDFAKNMKGLINARMAFDRESLQPLYHLEIGEAGESCALYIAQRLGFPKELLARAEKEAYQSTSTEQVEQRDNIFSVIESEKQEIAPLTQNIKKEVVQNPVSPISESYQVGDSVKVFPEKLIGIVFRPANEKGELIIQIKGEKQVVNHKRIKLLTPASELYPEDYDFSIIFDSVENRKARHAMNRKYAPDSLIIYEDE